MDGYNFWQDFFDTYQSLSDGTKALWLIVPAAFVLGLIALVMRHRVAVRQAESGMRGDLVYTIHRDANDKLHVYRHGAALDSEPALLLLDQPISDRAVSGIPAVHAKHGSAMTPG
jgi:hypothetical protein